MNREISSVYIHIPFCKKICTYCDFCHLLYKEEFATIYLMSLEKEIIERYQKEEIKTIYIGGGTPSALPIVHLKKLFNIINRFNLSEDFEFTFECNLDDIRYELLEVLKESKVNRLSIGIESFNEDKLEFLGREADFKDAKTKINLCRSLGFNNINLDLMYAVPDETVGELKLDIKRILKLKPEHISTYSLIIEEQTMLKNQNVEYIDEKLDAKMYSTIKKRLKRKKYNHYEISNFALAGKESKHNLVYWNNEEYYGFGLGAAGYYAGVRYENTKNLKKYASGEYVKEQNLLSKKIIMDYELMLGFRKLKGIDVKDFENKYSISIFDVYDIKSQIISKNLILEKNYLYVNPKKIYVMNDILVKLI